MSDDLTPVASLALLWRKAEDEACAADMASMRMSGINKSTAWRAATDQRLQADALRLCILRQRPETQADVLTVLAFMVEEIEPMVGEADEPKVEVNRSVPAVLEIATENLVAFLASDDVHPVTRQTIDLCLNRARFRSLENGAAA